MRPAGAKLLRDRAATPLPSPWQQHLRTWGLGALRVLETERGRGPRGNGQWRGLGMAWLGTHLPHKPEFLSL